MNIQVETVPVMPTREEIIASVGQNDPDARNFIETALQATGPHPGYYEWFQKASVTGKVLGNIVRKFGDDAPFCFDSIWEAWHKADAAAKSPRVSAVVTAVSNPSGPNPRFV